MSYLSRVSDTLEVEEKADPDVLVVEDEEMVAELYLNWLQDEGFDADVALGGVEGLRKIDGDVDVVLLDRRMPDLPGDCLLEVVRSEDIYNLKPPRFQGSTNYAGYTEDDWDRDISLKTTRKLSPDLVEEVQKKVMEVRVCMVTAVKPGLDLLEMDFDHYLVKDVSREEVIDTVEALSDLANQSDTVQKYQALRWKRKLIEDRFTEQQLEQDNRYQALVDVMEEIEQHAGAEVAKVSEVPL